MGDDGAIWHSELISRASSGYCSQSGAGGRRQLILQELLQIKIVVGSAWLPGESELLHTCVSFSWPSLAVELLFHWGFLISCFYHSGH